MSECKFTVDQEKKLIKVVWSGRLDYTEIEELCNAVVIAMKKFKKGEVLILGDTRNLDMRFIPPGADKILQDNYALSISYCKKSATLVSSIMLEKQFEKSATSGDVSNFRMFDSEAEAMAWLLE